jgi:hypothetical protein
MKVWITKYALTIGIYTIEGAVTESTDTNMLIGKVDGYQVYYHNQEWHKTEEEAKQRAEGMRLTKIKSLKKSLAKFEKMKF